MDMLEAIERGARLLRRCSDQVKTLKLLASESLPSSPYSVQAGCPEPDYQLQIVAGYLALGPGLEQDELLNTLLNCAQQVVRAEGAGLTLYDEQKDLLVFRAATGVAAVESSAGRCPLPTHSTALLSKAPRVISSTPMNRAIDEATGVTYRNVLIAPLLINDEAIGTVSAAASTK